MLVTFPSGSLRITVAFCTPAPAGSSTLPVNLPAFPCAGNRRAAIGITTQSAATALHLPALRDTPLRSVLALNMAANLLSKKVAPTNARADDHPRNELRKLPASPRTSRAYALGAIPRRSTTSSQARSLSCRSRRAAIHTNGLHQCTAHKVSAVICDNQSALAT